MKRLLFCYCLVFAIILFDKPQYAGIFYGAWSIAPFSMCHVHAFSNFVYNTDSMLHFVYVKGIFFRSQKTLLEIFSELSLKCQRVGSDKLSTLLSIFIIKF